MEQLNGIFRGAAKEKWLEFPWALCETLAVLTLSFRDIISLQLTANFNSLRSLNLTGVHISRNVVERLLSSDYVKLENVFSASNLKNLTIVNLCSSGKFWVVGGFEPELQISAPKLVSFCYSCAYEDKDVNHIFCPSSFTGLDRAKTLTLSTLAVKHFASTTSNLSWDTFILDKLNHLGLELRYNANQLTEKNLSQMETMCRNSSSSPSKDECCSRFNLPLGSNLL
ncbi:hypothetical protein CDL12_08978 [Handroanthus impetiginosus]|uniref:Uncharacterized protein n=1 Tax=Handroanthus impetiginosus TaxID=429701 RepID=A0A2G9HLG0_9LAMI|nr:hypothetical protein CDL12_08978 [Handroanthus impetiginosus]